MDIQPLNGILKGIGSRGEWDEQRQLKRLMGQWEAIVGASVAQHSCPLEVHNGILQVATSTAVWSQNLSFERRRILKKLNQRAHFKILGLKEIRFSTAQWHNRPGSSGAVTVDKRLNSYQQQIQWQQHPSRLPPPENEQPHPEEAESATQAFDRWSQRRQQQINQVPPCPQCKTPAPEGELQRWGVCAFCMTQQWQADKNANQPDGSQEAESWKKGPPSSVTVEETRQAEACQAESTRPSADTDEQAQDSELSPNKVHGAMFQRLKDKLSAESPQPRSQRRSKPEPGIAPRQLQPRTGLPPVAWPRPTAPANVAPPTTPSQPAPASGNNQPELSSPAPTWLKQISFQGKSYAISASIQGLSQDPSLTGPLAPLQGNEQPPLARKESLPNLKSTSPPEHQKQAVWAQAFQGLQSQEVQRQLQQAELERRTAARMRQVRSDCEADALQKRSQPASAYPTPNLITPEEGDAEAIQKTSDLASGHSKPVLKEKY